MKDKIIKKFKEVTEKECYRVIISDEEPSILDDKIGGKPYLPVGEEYPKDKKGNNLALLLQINLKNIELENYPKEGILEVFMSASMMFYPSEYQVKYFPEGLEYQTDLPEVNCSEFIIEKPIKISLEKTIDYMPISDYRFEETIIDVVKEVTDENISDVDDLENIIGEDWYAAFDYKLGNYITIGGYADFTQTDPRTYENEDMTECLFKLDSCADGMRFNIGDCGIAFVLISANNIKNRKFEKALVDWDCC